MGRARKIAGRVLIGVVVLVAVSGGGEAWAERRATQRYPAPGRMVNVGGTRMHILCTGEKGAAKDAPTIVLESGFGGWSVDWAGIQPDIAKLGRVCSYDRAGLGWSGPAKGGSTRSDIARRLHSVLATAGERGPYVLVGHSMGGFFVRELARQHPNEVAAMVLVDSSHEDMGNRFPPEELAGAKQQLGQLRWARPLMYLGVQRLLRLPISNAKDLPKAQRPVAYAIGYRARAYNGLYAEAKPILEEQLAGTLKLGTIPPVPLMVLTSEENLQGERGKIWRGLQDELAAMSPCSRHQVAKGSGHFIQVDRPDIVLAAIDDVLSRECPATAA